MPKFIFICDHSCDLDTHVVKHEFNAENIYEVVEQFEFFLKGSSYYTPGRLDFVDEESHDPVQHTKQYYDTTRNR